MSHLITAFTYLIGALLLTIIYLWQKDKEEFETFRVNWNDQYHKMQTRIDYLEHKHSLMKLDEKKIIERIEALNMTIANQLQIEEILLNELGDSEYELIAKLTKKYVKTEEK